MSYYKGLRVEEIEIGALYTPHSDCKPYCIAFDCSGISREQIIHALDSQNYFMFNGIDVYEKIVMLIDMVHYRNNSCMLFLHRNKMMCLSYNEFVRMMMKLQ